MKKRQGKYTNKVKKTFKKIEVPEYHFYKNKKRLEELLTKEANGGKLTEEERKEKISIKENAFTHFNKNDYQAVIRSFEKYDPEDYKGIASYVKKDVKEVREYIEELFNRIKTLKDGEKVINNIQRLNN